jgi:hypothetical protein
MNTFYKTISTLGICGMMVAVAICPTQGEGLLGVIGLIVGVVSIRAIWSSGQTD